MLVDEFIENYCEPTPFTSQGSENTYQVYLTSPAAIMSTMISADSRNIETPEQAWHETLSEKRRDNKVQFGLDGTGPLHFLEKEGFRTPLCILTHREDIHKFHNGHHRLAAAIDMGYERIPVIFVEFLGEHYDDRWNATELLGRTLDVIVPPPGGSE